MNSYDLTHLTLHAIPDEKKVSPSIQETMYFISLLTKSEDEFDHRYHFCGPYSDSVSESLNKLKAIGFAQSLSFPQEDSTACKIETSKHCYRLTYDGIRIAEQKAKHHPATWRKIKKASDKLCAAGNISHLEMSIAAKSHFTAKRTNTDLRDEIARNINAAGWNADETEVQEMITFLSKLGLA